VQFSVAKSISKLTVDLVTSFFILIKKSAVLVISVCCEITVVFVEVAD